MATDSRVQGRKHRGEPHVLCWHRDIGGGAGERRGNRERLRADDAKLATKMAGMDLAAVMKSADPQSEALARFTGLSPATMRDALAVLVAVLIELGSGFGLWVVTVGSEAKMAAAPLLNAQSPSMAGASSPQAKMAAAPLPVKKPAQNRSTP